MTYRALCERLARAGVPDEKTDASLLLSHFFGIDAAALHAFPDRDYTSEAFMHAVGERERRVPLQHILGKCYFFDECYEVTPDCLIPRADTELLVEAAASLLPHGALFADFCTGSGCIALSVLSHRADLSAVAADVSAKALAVARRNAQALSLTHRITFWETDLLSSKLPFDPPAYILSNPPYIAHDVLPTLAPEIAYEPALALDGGADGLIFYRTFLSRFSPMLFLFEIGFDQADAVAALGEEAGYTPTIQKDYGRRDRLLILRK